MKTVTRNYTLSLLLIAAFIFTGCATTTVQVDTAGIFRPDAVRAAKCNYGGAIKSVEAVDQYTIRFTLCEPDSTFAAKIAAPIFAVQDSDVLAETGGDSVLISQNPVGTGPYVLREWRHEIDTTIVTSPTYWGIPAGTPKIEFRWQPDQSRRFSDTDFTAVEGMDFPSIVMTKPFSYLQYTYANPDLKIESHDPLNLYYLGFNNKIPPFDNVKVRQAFSMALDRAQLLDLSFPGGTELAQQVIPTGVKPGRTEDMRWYEFDATRATELLTEAGFDFNQEITIAYQNSPMQSLYSPAALAMAVRDQLAKINVKVILRPLDVIELEKNLKAGSEMFFVHWYMIDYLDGSAFFDKPFVNEADKFGESYSRIPPLVKEVNATGVDADKQKIFDELNRIVMEEVPLIPLGHSPRLTVFRATLQNIASNAFYENLDEIVSDKNTIRFIAAAEPQSLWPADEDDFTTFRVTRLLYDRLLSPGFAGEKFEPLLAESWESNEDLTEWTFHLRYNVQFSNGSNFDANDVVASFSAIWDASDPNHKGRTGEFAMYKRLFGNLINAE